MLVPAAQVAFDAVSYSTSFCFTEVMQATDLSSSMESLTYETSSLSSPTNSSTMGAGGVSQQQQQQTRTKRMRTSFKHHQLRTMKSYFNINQNPDAKDLKQLAQKTGLSKRVLQVSRWTYIHSD